MMTAKDAYEYMFYKSYKFFFLEESQSMREWRAVTFLIILEGMFYYSFKNYYVIFFNRYLDTSTYFKHELIILTIILVGVNDYYFLMNKRWKQIISKYDKWPKKKNRMGTFVMWAVVVAVFINFFVSLNLVAQIDWSLYK